MVIFSNFQTDLASEGFPSVFTESPPPPLPDSPPPPLPSAPPPDVLPITPPPNFTDSPFQVDFLSDFHEELPENIYPLEGPQTPPSEFTDSPVTLRRQKLGHPWSLSDAPMGFEDSAHVTSGNEGHDDYYILPGIYSTLQFFYFPQCDFVSKTLNPTQYISISDIHKKFKILH